MIDFESRVDPGSIAEAADTLSRRGPDDSGVWASENVGLGHRRLAILDTSSYGHQPMLSADGRYVIVFNGEIYNFMEIRRAIDDNDASWRSRSDTEVILAAFAKWGPNCLQRFHGMFAFAIWDRKEKALFAARDRLGVKPFYYHYCGKCFAFASRPRALLALDPSWSGPLDEQALRFYLEVGYVPAPYSIFQAIRKLPPAHWLLLRNGNVSIERYWDFRHIPPEPSWENRREEDLLDELDELLQRSVRSRMISDVPLGAFLSGGIDSSVVVAAMARHSTQPVKTFTIGFSEKRFDESEHARAVSQHIGSEHYCEHLNVDDLLQLMPLFTEEYDEPFADSSAFSTMAVSRAARSQVTVSLSGDGGDELFGGYHYYQIVQRLEAFYGMPNKVRKSLSSLARMAPQHRLKLLSGALQRSNIADAFYFCRSVTKDFDEILLPEVLNRTVSMRELFADAERAFPAGLTGAETGMRLDAFYTLPDDYLQKVDVASMAFSLESRDPLLDQDLVEWAMRLPLKWKLRGSQNKYLLRKLAYRYVPRKILDRPKKGFEVPVGEWLKGHLRQWAESRLHDVDLASRVALNHSSVLTMAATHNSGRRNVHPLLWSVLMLLNFLKQVTPCAQQLIPAGITQ